MEIIGSVVGEILSDKQKILLHFIITIENLKKNDFLIITLYIGINVDVNIRKIISISFYDSYLIFKKSTKNLHPLNRVLSIVLIK